MGYLSWCVSMEVVFYRDPPVCVFFWGSCRKTFKVTVASIADLILASAFWVHFPLFASQFLSTVSRFYLNNNKAAQAHLPWIYAFWPYGNDISLAWQRMGLQVFLLLSPFCPATFHWFLFPLAQIGTRGLLSTLLQKLPCNGDMCLPFLGASASRLGEGESSSLCSMW